MKSRAFTAVALLPLIGLFLGCSGGLGLALSSPSKAVQGQRHRDPVAILKAADAPLATRNPDLVALKIQQMSASPFAFFRGSAVLFYADARSDARLGTSIEIPLQGDFHLENLGTYRTASGPVAYDLNDFDEAFTGAYLWELARCAVSIHLAADEHLSLSAAERDALSRRFLGSVHRRLVQLQRSPGELSSPLRETELTGPARAAIHQAEKQDRGEFLQKLAPQARFKTGKKVREVDAATRQAVADTVRGYAAGRLQGEGYYQVKDVAERIAGVASLGRYRYIALIEGPTASPGDDVVLELKEALPSASGLGKGQDDASRVLQAYRYFLPEADPLLGMAKFRGQGMLVREHQPAKGGVELADLKSKSDFSAFLEDAALVAARTLARSGQGSRILAEMASAEDLEQRVGSIAAEYVRQVESDYKAFTKGR